MMTRLLSYLLSIKRLSAALEAKLNLHLHTITLHAAAIEEHKLRIEAHTAEAALAQKLLNVLHS